MRCPNCLTENPPNAKFCLECGNRLVVCPHCGTINLPMAKFCIECGTPLLATLTTASENTSFQPVLTGRAQYPADLDGGSRIGLTPPDERRVVTIMFADITGSTPLADKLDPEDLRAILAGYFNLMTEQIRRHGGTVEKYIGDAVMAVFGEPIAHEDDPDRAIRAALDMQVALVRFNQRRLAQDPAANRLQMRIGINTGEVAAPSAQFRRHDFLITGDAVNVAARLQQVATPDMILVGERAYLATRNVFADVFAVDGSFLPTSLGV
ncbi:MAG TPA: adenylate/guanylate cyclase domain-containing protein, partial [Ktedonobacteraceae bacterium]